ncbi:hypothetical protein BGX28_003337 [Mortierella sp. GBA30]|nr:hypothetical protein BGX28_003337 [Mortierella sp. GBA30]
METNGFHGPGHSASSDLDDSSNLDTSSSTTAIITPSPSTRRYSVAGVIRSLFHAVLVQDTEHLDHVLTSLSLDPNRIRDKEGKSMLMVAATENKHRVLRYLLALPSIDVDMQDEEGETALYQAAAAGSTECVQLLLHAGASARLGNEESITPLIIASYNGFVSICRLLVAIGHADVNQQDNTLKSALLLASYAGHIDIMAELIEHGASLNVLDQYGWSSLMLAAYAGKLEACKLLLTHGADPHIRTANGKNARSLSWDAGHKAVASYISKFLTLTRDTNLSTSSSGTSSGPGSGISMSSKTIIQQILPPVPRSPSRRTHSPSPSLPSVPEEAQEEDHNYRTRRSFSAHNSTISRQSVLSSRLSVPPKGRRPRSINVGPIRPKLGLEEPISPIPTAADPDKLSDIFTERNNYAYTSEHQEDAVSPASTRTDLQQSPNAGTASIANVRSLEKSRSVIKATSEAPAAPTQIYSVNRDGIIPRHGAKNIDYLVETQRDNTDSNPATSPLESNNNFRLLGFPSKSPSEREKEGDMEKNLNRRTDRRRRLMKRPRNEVWLAMSRLLTICCPTRTLPHAWDKDRCQDWREKMALCLLITGLSITFGYIVFGLALITCRPNSSQSISPQDFKMQYGISNSVTKQEQLSIVRGAVYDIGGFVSEGLHPLAEGNVTSKAWDSSLSAYYGGDMSFLFPLTDLVTTCELFGLGNSFGKCSESATAANHCHQTHVPMDMIQKFIKSNIIITYNWEDVQGGAAPGRKLFVYDGTVLDITDYLAQPLYNITPSERTRMEWLRGLVGKDATTAVERQVDRKSLSHCLQASFKVGVLSGQTNGCLASVVINTLALVVLLLITLMRLASALVYRWVFTNTHSTQDTAYSANSKVNSPLLTLVTCRATDQEAQIKFTLDSLVLAHQEDSTSLLLVVADEVQECSPGGASQGSQACLGLMDQSAALVSTVHEKASLGLADVEHEVKSFAVCSLQQAETAPDSVSGIYSGHYRIENRRVPYVLISIPSSRRRHRHQSQADNGTWSKKRLVVRWLYRIYFNEPVTAFEYSLFEKTKALLNCGPDCFDFLLMATMGSQCDSKSIGTMITTLQNNERVVGVRARRRISNGSENWLTRIQEYENHLLMQFTAPFESTLGTVQCLPSEFSLLRIKMATRRVNRHDNGIHIQEHASGCISVNINDEEAPGQGSPDEEVEKVETGVENGNARLAKPALEQTSQTNCTQFSTPILLHPDVASVFVGNKAHTLHERSMIIDGAEDRYLTGLLHRTFPDRLIVYRPDVSYSSSVPAKFSAYMYKQSQCLVGRFCNSWEQLRLLPEPRRPGMRGMFFPVLVLSEWLSPVLSPVLVVLTWAIVILVTLGAVTKVGALFSLPIVLALAFMLCATLLRPILGAFLWLGHSGLVAGLFHLPIFLFMIPVKDTLIPLYAFWHFDSTFQSDRYDEDDEPHIETLPVVKETDQMLQTTAQSSTASSRRVRYLAQWHSMNPLKTQGASCPQEPQESQKPTRAVDQK